jgi:hypothetical protein
MAHDDRFQCQCGQTFQSVSIAEQHYRFCDLHIKWQEQLTKVFEGAQFLQYPSREYVTSLTDALEAKRKAVDELLAQVKSLTEQNATLKTQSRLAELMQSEWVDDHVLGVSSIGAGKFLVGWSKEAEDASEKFSSLSSAIDFIQKLAGDK